MVVIQLLNSFYSLRVASTKLNGNSTALFACVHCINENSNSEWQALFYQTSNQNSVNKNELNAETMC